MMNNVKIPLYVNDVYVLILSEFKKASKALIPSLQEYCFKRMNH